MKRKKRGRPMSRQVRILPGGDRDGGRKRDIEPVKKTCFRII